MLPLIMAGARAAMTAAGGAKGLGSLLGMTIAPMIVDHVMAGGPSEEDKAKVKSMLDAEAMKRAQEQGIPLSKAQADVQAEMQPLVEKALADQGPGAMTQLAAMLAGGVIGHKLGGKVAQSRGMQLAERKAAAPARAQASKLARGNTAPGSMPPAPGPTAPPEIGENVAAPPPPSPHPQGSYDSDDLLRRLTSDQGGGVPQAGPTGPHAQQPIPPVAGQGDTLQQAMALADQVDPQQRISDVPGVGTGSMLRQHMGIDPVAITRKAQMSAMQDLRRRQLAAAQGTPDYAARMAGQPVTEDIL